MEARCTLCGNIIETDEYGHHKCGIDNDQKMVCYPCCGIMDKKHMDDKGIIYLYLTGDVDKYCRHEVGIERVKITNWPNSLQFQPMTLTRRYGHTPQGYRYPIYHATFLDHNGKKWYAVMRGRFTELCRCVRYKGQ